MRPLDDVLATARADIQYCSEIRPGIHPRTRRELEEWEAKLSGWEGGWINMPSTAKRAAGDLAEVRQLLGRGEPEPRETTTPGPKPGESDAVNIAMLRFAASMLEVRGFPNLASMVRFSGDEITRLQKCVAELEARKPAMLVQEVTGRWHAFEDGCDPRIDAVPMNSGYVARASVQDWIWYPRERADR